MSTTTKITQINRKNCGEIKAMIEETLKPLAEELGVSIKLANGNFTADNLKMPIEVSIIGENDMPMGRDQQAFKSRARLYGLSPTDLGREYFDRVRNRTYIVWGLRPRSHKFPILVKEKTTGKIWKLPGSQVKQLLDSQ